MPLAARIGDHHTCPKIEPGPMSHVGGAMVSAGCPSVRIGDRPAAREGDHAICAVALDRVRLGEPSVLIGDRPAARAGDPTDHGGVVAAGAPNVLIGSSSQAITLRKAAAKGAAFCEECARMQRESKPKAAPRQPAPGAAAKVVLVTPVMGRLSAAYETSGQGPGATAHTEGDYGGASYGTYQISTAVGTMTSFLEWLKAAHPEWRTRLRAHPQGSGAFDRVWKAIAAEEPQAFFDAQDASIASMKTIIDGTAQALADMDVIITGYDAATAVQQRGMVKDLARAHKARANAARDTAREVKAKAQEAKNVARAIRRTIRVVT